MLWVGWREQRTETVITVAVLVVLAGLLIPTGLHVAAAYDNGHLADCLGRAGSQGCRDAVDAFVARFAHLGELLSWLTLLPGLIGVLLAAPLISQLEHGTHRLDWTQSITRHRWLAGKLGLAVATTIAAAVVLTLLVTWWRAPFVHLQGRVNTGVFDTEGTVVAAYAIFALGLAAATGAVWRRSAPALIVSFVGYFAARLFVDTFLRQRLVAPVTGTYAIKGGPDLSRAWVLEQFPVDADGAPIKLLSCPHNAGGLCEAKPEFASVHAVFHPASHFWALQIRETALFGLAGLVLLGFAAWRTARA